MTENPEFVGLSLRLSAMRENLSNLIECSGEERGSRIYIQASSKLHNILKYSTMRDSAGCQYTSLGIIASASSGCTRKPLSFISSGQMFFRKQKTSIAVSKECFETLGFVEEKTNEFYFYLDSPSLSYYGRFMEKYHLNTCLFRVIC